MLAAVVVPPLVVMVLALNHPGSLTLGSAMHWKQMHTYLMPIFPLLALGPWLVARAVDRVTSWVVLALAYVYAVFYTALDIVAGVIGGALKEAEAGGLGIVFPIAQDFEQIGGIAFVLACALSAGVAMQATGWLRGALPAASVVVGAICLWQNHIFRPWGVVAMILLALGWGAFTLLLDRRQTPVTA